MISRCFSNRDKHARVNVYEFLHLDHFLSHSTKQNQNAKFDNLTDDYDVDDKLTGSVNPSFF